jgi:hypothetical protein
MTIDTQQKLVCIRLKDHDSPHVPSYADLCSVCYETVWRSEQSPDDALEAICMQCAVRDMLRDRPSPSSEHRYVLADLEERMPPSLGTDARRDLPRARPALKPARRSPSRSRRWRRRPDPSA